MTELIGSPEYKEAAAIQASELLSQVAELIASGWTRELIELGRTEKLIPWDRIEELNVDETKDFLSVDRRDESLIIVPGGPAVNDHSEKACAKLQRDQLFLFVNLDATTTRLINSPPYLVDTRAEIGDVLGIRLVNCWYFNGDSDEFARYELPEDEGAWYPLPVNLALNLFSSPDCTSGPELKSNGLRVVYNPGNGQGINGWYLKNPLKDPGLITETSQRVLEVIGGSQNRDIILSSDVAESLLNEWQQDMKAGRPVKVSSFKDEYQGGLGVEITR